MKLLKNRTALGILRIVSSLVICFLAAPLFNQVVSEKTDIMRVQKAIKAGDEITEDKVQMVEVGGYSPPENVMKDLGSVVGAYATADLLPGDYVLYSKISVQPPGTDTYLYQLDGMKQAISATVKSFAAGVSDKLRSGDIVSILAPDYRGMGGTAIPQKLQYVQVIAVTASTDVDANTAGGDKEKEKSLPATLTLLAAPIQCKVLAELETGGNPHAILVHRGKVGTAGQFVVAQEQLLERLYPLEEATGGGEGGTETQDRKGTEGEENVETEEVEE